MWLQEYMDRPEKISKLENINHVYACMYEWDYLGMCVRCSDSHIHSTLKSPGKVCSATAGHEVQVRMAGQSKFIWIYNYLEWI